jgi:hypothetical protein
MLIKPFVTITIINSSKHREEINMLKSENSSLRKQHEQATQPLTKRSPTKAALQEALSPVRSFHDVVGA